MTIFDEMAADVVEIFAEFGKPIRINDRHFSALVAEPELSLELEAGGFNSAGNFTVKMLRSDWLVSKPVVGTLVTYDDKHFRVIRLVSRPPHPLVILTMEPV
ncbi:MAG: hypothetical protein FGM15_05285 [Chthoniobacterales bacterium]|nr:hypothetical protein [Chthoniobacterales bacterium]